LLPAGLPAGGRRRIARVLGLDTPQRCVAMQAIMALTARAASGAGRTPSHSPGGDGGEAEGRMPFAAVSADARGGLKARSAFQQCTPRANIELSPGTSRRLAPACTVPATDPRQRVCGTTVTPDTLPENVSC